MQCADDIGVVIEPRVLNGRPNASARSQVHDGICSFAVKHSSHRFALAKIDMANRYVAQKPGNVRVLDLRIVKIVEVVQDDNFMPGGEQLLNKMRPNETRAACYQDPHGAKLATDGHGWTQILRSAD